MEAIAIRRAAECGYAAERQAVDSSSYFYLVCLSELAFSFFFAAVEVSSHVDPTIVAAPGAVRNLSSLRRSVGAEVAPDTVCTSMVAILHEATALGLRTVASAEQMEVAVGGQKYVAFFWYSRCMALLCKCLKEWCALESQAEADVPGFG
jgi:hypothetical protein